MDSMLGAAQAIVDDAEHYVGAVAALSASHEVSAAADIVTSSGIKLVARGTRIDENLRAKLRGHGLSATAIEQNLAIHNGVSAKTVAEDLARLIDGDRWFVRLAAHSGDPSAMRHGASRLQIPREILFRLTVARDQRPALYRHSLGVAVIAHYLGLRSRERRSVIDGWIIAALCHDLGELLTDPTVLESGRRISDEERRFIYVHPISGWLIVRDLPGLSPEIGRAVIQHQERLDGSGYPYGKTATEIGMAGRVLAAADVAESIMARFGDHRRLSTLLRLNQKKYDRNVIGLLHEAIIPEVPVVSRFEGELVMRRLEGLAELLAGWGRLRAETGIIKSAPGQFLSERMFNLRQIVVQFGFDPDSLEGPVRLAEEDAVIAAELMAVIDEVQFQMAELGREYDRRAVGWMSEVDPVMATLLDEWRRQLKALVEA